MSSTENGDPSAAASLLAHYMLVQDEEKIGVKKSAISQKILNVTPGMRDSRQDIEGVVEEASSLLERSMGLRIVPVPNRNTYILVNTLEGFNGLQGYLRREEHDENSRGLLCIALASILMIGDELPESSLWSLLENVGVHKDDKHHPVFGDVGKTIHRFVKQHYLDFVKGGRDNATYSWGFRAMQEFDRMEILGFVAGVFNDGREAKDFTAVHRRIVKGTLPTDPN